MIKHKPIIALLILNLFLLNGVGFSQNQIIDSLKLRLNEVEGEDRIRALIGLSYHYLRISIDSSLIYSNQALSYSENTDNERGVARALLMKGSANNYLGNYHSAIKYQLEALSIFEDMGDTAAVGITYNNLGTNYQCLGEYSKAIEQYQHSLQIAKEQSNDISIYYALNNIGSIYEDWGKYSMALEHHQNALSIAKNIDDKGYIGISLHNIGVAYNKLKQYKNALVYFDSSFVIRQEEGDKKGLFNILINRGEVYIEINEPQKSIESFKDALDLVSGTTNKTDIALASLKLGETYLFVGETGKVNALLQEALNLSKETGEIKYLKDSFKALSDYYSQIDDFENAYSNYIEYTAIKDTIFNRDSRREISEMETLYELDKKETEIEIQNLKIDQQQARFYYIISGVILLIILTLLLFSRYKLKQKQVRTELEKKNIDIEQRLLRTQMNPHFIFNSLNSINSFITDNNSDAAQTFLSKFARLMRYILENSRKTMVPVEDDIVTLELNLELERLRFDNKFDFKIEVEEGLDKENIYIPPMLLQPFVENAVLHGVASLEGKGMISIKMTPKNKVMLCVVEDNGVGRERAMEIKNQSGKSKHRSLGMQVTQERLDILNEKTEEEVFVRFVDLKDDKNNSLGTRVELQIPFEEE